MKIINIKSVPALLAFSALAACASQQECDPNEVSNVFSSIMCSSSGQFEARQTALSTKLDSIQTQVQSERTAIRNAKSKIRVLEAKQRLTETQRISLNRQMAALNADVDRLEHAQAGSAEATALQTRIQQQKDDIDNYLNISVF